MKKIITIIIGLVLAFTFVSSVSAATPDELVGWWKMDDASDSSAYTNDGAETNVTFSSGSALFNGSTSKIVVPDSSSLDITGEITIEAWVKPDVVNSYRTIVSKRSGGLSNYSLRFWNGKLEFYYRSPGDTHWSEWSTNNAVTLEGTDWHHVALTYKWTESEPIIYFNGSDLEGDWVHGDGENVVSPSNYQLHIGYNYPGFPQAFDGLIGEVRIWDRALTEEELIDNWDGVFGEADLCPETTPEILETLGVNRWIWDGSDWITASKGKDKDKGPKKSFDMDYTYGCSCEQILKELTEAGLGEFEGHRKHGCSSSILEDFHKDGLDGEEIDGEYYLETVKVPSDETIVPATSTIKDDEVYRLQASGTYIYATWAGDPVADAKCSDRGTADPLDFTGWISGDILPSPYTNYLEVKINNNVVDWGVASGDCDPDNQYSMEYTGASHLDFNIYDGGSTGDNSGSINVDIFAKLY